MNVKTWLWVDSSTWGQRTSSVSVPGVAVIVVASPESVVWDMGEGGRVVCAGPGRPYDVSRRAAEQSTDCGYTYRRPSGGEPGGAFTVTATTRWHVTYAVTGAAGGGDLGYVERSSQTQLRVMEVHALNQAGAT